MKKSIENIQGRSKVWMIGLLLCNLMAAYGQFQTTIGFPIPTEEKSPGGIITPNGEYLILGDNNIHPNSIGGIPDGDLQLDWIDNLGTFTRQSRMLGGYYFDNAAWIENAKDCVGADAYIIASTTRKVMVLTLTDPNGTPIWSREIGNITANSVLTSACVKMDANGFFIIVGTATDLTTGYNSIIAVQVDCSGNQLWSKDYILNNYSATTSSVTAFATVAAGQGSYYLTGKAVPKSGGNEQVFILNLSTLSGGFNFMNLYDISPLTDDAGTCIQGSNAPAPNGGIWVSGYSHDINALKTALMFRANLNGTPIWTNNYDIQGGDEFANHFQFAANGKLIVTGKASEFQPFQSTKAGDCMLMRMDAFTGNALDFTREFIGNGFSSQGNRVEEITIDEYFITGQSLELNSPSVSASNILAIRTDNQSVTDTTCYIEVATQILPQAPTVSSISPAAVTIGFPPDFNPSTLGTLDFNDQQRFCSFPPADCDLTWITKNCFEVEFTASIVTTAAGNYTFDWDFDCDGTYDAQSVVGTNTNTISHTYPCGGGNFTVCVRIEDPFGFQCFVTHTITVPSTCCGQITVAYVECTPDSNVYSFGIVYDHPVGVGSCNYNLTTLSGTIVPGSLNFSPVFSPPGVIATGLIFVPNIIPLNLNFLFQSNCICTATGLPTTCSVPVSIPTICCKEIRVDDHIVCEDAATYDVPIIESVWPPLNNITQVTWYVMPKPPGGCPTIPWGGIPYQDGPSSTLTPLHLYPVTLTTDLCVYAVVQLDEGPCRMITSNIACISLCAATTCSLNDYDYCYSGTPIVPGLLTATFSSPANACPLPLLDWFDPNGLHVQTGGATYQPTTGLSMVDPVNNCYEDFYYTLQITDECGTHSCQSRVRLYSDIASPGMLVMDPNESPFLCPNGDATLKFLPECAGEPETWSWFSRPCIGGTPIPIQDAGAMNPSYNTNQLSQSVIYSVQTQNGVCPADMVDLLVEVKDPLSIVSFSGVSDPCVEQFVTLTLDFLPCTIAGCNTGCNCTYTVDWYKDGFLIGTSPNILPSQAIFTNTSTPLAGNYYAVITADCCPDESQATQVITFNPSCEPWVLGPCFICDGIPVTLCAHMVIPPSTPCPDFCTFEWFDGSGNSLGTTTCITVSQGGNYTLQSNCNGCIKTFTFFLRSCTSMSPFPPFLCGLVSVENILPIEETTIRLFPNPTSGELTVEWQEGAPDDTRLFITDLDGRRIQIFNVANEAKSIDVSLAGLPAGLYFMKIQSADRMTTVAKVVKE